MLDRGARANVNRVYTWPVRGKSDKANGSDSPDQAVKSEKPQELQCGIVMPISAIDGCTAEHWLDVLAIFKEAITSISAPIFKPNLVSYGDESGIIQKRIVQNLYSSDMVVCNVSGKNPNVMFELGLRLAFDKPTVIVKDDKTGYSFDTGIIEHVDILATYDSLRSWISRLA